MIEREFVPFELAVKLKELGFDLLCFASYSPTGAWSLIDPKSNEFMASEVACPLWQQAFEWFRVNESYDVVIKRNGLVSYKAELLRLGNYVNPVHIEPNLYEKVRYTCLEKLIELSTPPPTA